MTGKFICILTLLSVIYGIITHNQSALTEAVLNEPVNAVELAVYLCGGMCFWSGLMRVAEKAGITSAVSSALKKPLSLLFHGINTEGRAFSAICMNITANMLGLGNAATPLGIEAMKALAEEENCGDTAGDNMIIFAVLNTASITLIPTTAASLRLKYGAAEPLDILPAVILTSAVSLTVSLTAAKLGCLIGRKNKRKEAHHG